MSVLDERDQYVVVSTPTAWEEFVKSQIWRDMVGLVKDKIFSLYQEYTTIKPDDVGLIASNQALIMAYESLLDLPEHALDEAKAIVEEEALRREEMKNAERTA